MRENVREQHDHELEDVAVETCRTADITAQTTVINGAVFVATEEPWMNPPTPERGMTAPQWWESWLSCTCFLLLVASVCGRAFSLARVFLFVRLWAYRPLETKAGLPRPLIDIVRLERAGHVGQLHRPPPPNIRASKSLYDTCMKQSYNEPSNEFRTRN